ncbi:hypothetical protein ANN_18464 [Periplaneta americana]|uniref:Uncharacterized protein n=1 Tax=Periplaneta americana TaxID=6978 RepID=A0ABQ8SQ37_PERAM|nr:hypothetical protein ANN_18464 [Periplaneta americana]
MMNNEMFYEEKPPENTNCYNFVTMYIKNFIYTNVIRNYDSWNFYFEAGYTKWNHKRNENVMEELQLEPVINHVKHYRNNWINHLHRMRRDRIPKVMLHYRPNGKRSLGRPKKRWIENLTVTS